MRFCVYVLDYHEQLHESPFHKLAAKIKHHHSKHTHSPHPHHHSYTAQSSERHGKEETFYGSVDITKSTNKNIANSGISEQVNALSGTGIGTPVDTVGYDNAMTASASPKYDPVPREMSMSHDSNQSERIYAEVTEDIIGPTASTG